MDGESKLSRHWTDDQLITHLYGVGPEDGHVAGCLECASRLSSLQNRQEVLRSGEEPSHELLAAQRRRIYAKLTQPAPWWSAHHLRRWASAGAAALVLGGGVLYYEEYRQQQDRNHMISDDQLAQDVSDLSGNSEAQPTAPLQALFEE